MSTSHAQGLSQEAKSRGKLRPSRVEERHQPAPEHYGVTTARTRTRRPLGAFTLRAYSASPQARTATGTTPTNGRTIAVDPRVIPLGTVIEIEGIGKRVAEDTGGRVKGKKLDMFLPSVQACTQFGVQSRKVFIID